MPAALAVLGGALIAVQARVNGALAGRLGSAVLAALVSFVAATVALLAAVAVRRRRPRFARPLRWWWFLGGFAGAYVVSISAVAVPRIGVALLGVAIVGGQAAGGLAVDRAGLSPRGRQPLDAFRIAGAVLAVAGLGVAAVGRTGSAQPLLLAAVALAGFGHAGQQAANGHLQRVSGDAVGAALVSILVGTAALVGLVVVLAATGSLGTPDWPGNPGLYVAGFCGATYIAISAAVVSRLGVLRVTLAAVAGQLVGAVLLDAFAPTGTRLDARTLVATGLALIAVTVAGRSRVRGENTTN